MILTSDTVCSICMDRGDDVNIDDVDDEDDSRRALTGSSLEQLLQALFGRLPSGPRHGLLVAASGPRTVASFP